MDENNLNQYEHEESIPPEKRFREVKTSTQSNLRNFEGTDFRNVGGRNVFVGVMRPATVTQSAARARERGKRQKSENSNDGEINKNN